MSEVQRHYEDLLARRYSWMFGDGFDSKVEEQRRLLEPLVSGKLRGTALDLGAGSGFQTLALAKLGFRPIIAVDTSSVLLDELTSRARGLPIAVQCADIATLAAFEGVAGASVVVCMGDTLAHLASDDQVRALLALSSQALGLDGSLVLTFRDYSEPLLGLDRIIPVRSDADRIMTCVLDYEPEHVVVTDLVHEYGEEGWSLAKSSYRKLRLAPAAVAIWVEAAGFRVVKNEQSGRMHLIVGRKNSVE